MGCTLTGWILYSFQQLEKGCSCKLSHAPAMIMCTPGVPENRLVRGPSKGVVSAWLHRNETKHSMEARKRQPL